MSDKKYCPLCGGAGEVMITPYGMPDKHAAHYGCPFCIQEDRDKAERELAQLKKSIAAATTVKDSLTAAPAAPEGYMLVPIEPTPMMAKDAADAWLDCSDRLVLNKARAAVRAAIASYKGGRK